MAAKLLQAAVILHTSAKLTNTASLSFALKKKMEKEWPLGAFFESSTMAEVTILIIQDYG